MWQNVISLDTPVDNVFTIALQCARTNVNLNVDGSVIPRIFTINTVGFVNWHTCHVNFNLMDMLTCT